VKRRPGTKHAHEATLASETARKAAAAVLQVVSGLKTPAEASEAIGIHVNRYYVLEGRALAGMVRALEPLARGPRRKPEAEAQALRQQAAKAEREASRYQALFRASQRTLGLCAPIRKEQRPAPGAKRSRRPRVRAKALVAALTAPGGEAAAAPDEPGGTP
jgi:hypothetical protein